MAQRPEYSDPLCAARCIADYVVQTGVLSSHVSVRPVYHHMGAVLADAVLQAGLNYAKVVRPRVVSILKTFPDAANVNVLTEVIEAEGTARFLQWEHNEKIFRFDSLLAFVRSAGIEHTFDLAKALRDDGFRLDIRQVRGVGPKTVDYIACLVGLDYIAVDRHIRNFAQRAGLENRNYDYLRDVFTFAADLLCLSRREFDAIIWKHQSMRVARQLSLELTQ